MAIDADEFRAAMGAWPSGVTIITARAGEKIHGMTVSDFSGASLDPPLALVCASKTSHTTSMIQEGENFGVNVLRLDQDALSNRFASKKEEWSRFEGVETFEGPCFHSARWDHSVDLEGKRVGVREIQKEIAAHESRTMGAK